MNFISFRNRRWLRAFGRLRPIVVLAMLAVSLSACQSEDIMSPPDFLPPGDFLNAERVDTFTIVARVENDSLIRLDNPRYALLGNMWDAHLGMTSASFFSTVSVAQPIQSFGPQAQIDSVVLIMQFHDAYGDASKFTGVQDIEVFEVLETISPPSGRGYTMANIDFDISAEKIGSRRFVPQFGSGAQLSRLRIPLDKDVAERFLQVDSMLNSNVREQFKGVYLRAVTQPQTAGNGALTYFDLQNSTGTLIEIYYRNANAPTLVARLTFSGSQNIRINKFEHDRTVGASFLQDKLNDASFDYSLQSDLYIQPMQGLRLFVQIPSLLNLNSQGRYHINRATFTLPVKHFDTRQFRLPPSFMIYYYTPAGQIRILDEVLNSNFYDGTFDKDKKAFILRPTLYFQKLLNGNVANSGFYIDFPTLGKSFNAERAVISGPQDPIQPLHLELLITRLSD
jgi:hypothetical protein